MKVKTGRGSLYFRAAHEVAQNRLYVCQPQNRGAGARPDHLGVRPTARVRTRVACATSMEARTRRKGGGRGKRGEPVVNTGRRASRKPTHVSVRHSTALAPRAFPSWLDVTPLPTKRWMAVRRPRDPLFLDGRVTGPPKALPGRIIEQCANFARCNLRTLARQPLSVMAAMRDGGQSASHEVSTNTPHLKMAVASSAVIWRRASGSRRIATPSRVWVRAELSMTQHRANDAAHGCSCRNFWAEFHEIHDSWPGRAPKAGQVFQSVIKFWGHAGIVHLRNVYHLLHELIINVQ